MEKQILQVRAFQTAFGAPMPDKPTMLDEERAKLRKKLLQEEVTEFKKAETIEDVADALCDVMYITIGTAHEYGIADRFALLFDEVHNSNMSKMGEDGKPIYRKDGKVLKPEHWRPPNLKSILNRRYHLYSKDNATFADDLSAINEAEAKRWQDYVEGEIYIRLKWYHKWMHNLSVWLEKRIKRKVKVSHSVDNAYREVVNINAYGEETELVNY